MTKEALIALIAERLAGGLYHPGNGDDQAPMNLVLPMFRTTGMPHPVSDQVKLTTTLIIESIFYLIEHEGQCDIVPREEVK